MKNTFFAQILVISILTLVGVRGYADDAGVWIATAARVATPPVIDGQWEDTWSAAAPINGFREFRPAVGVPAEKDTDVYILYDDEAIYVGWICYEDRLDRLVACATVRDMWMNDDDCIDFLIDATNDRQSAYDFMVNWRGIQYDGTLTRDGGGGGKEWDGDWEAATSVGDGAWYCEMAIPWSTIRYERKAPSFGVQLMRFRKSVFEETFWASDGSFLNRVSTFGRVEGFSDLPRPRPLKITPYATARVEERFATPTFAYEESDGWEFEPRYGLDVEYRAGSVATALATALPDYAYVEADPASISLEPTETYLEEKRPFFTQGWDVFDTDGDYFYSRRLTEIAGGAKVMGRVGRFNYGAADVWLSDDDPRYPEDNFGVARVALDTYGGSTFGVMGIGRQELGGEVPLETGSGDDRSRYNNVVIADGRLAFPADFYVSYEGASSRTEGDGGDGYAYWGVVGKSGLTSSGATWYGETSADLRSDTSFLQPEDLDRREAGGELFREFQINRKGVRAFRGYCYYHQRWDRAGAFVDAFASPSVRLVTRNDFYGTINYRGGKDRSYVAAGYPEFVNDVFDFGVGHAPASWGDAGVSYWRGKWYGEYYHYYSFDVGLIPAPSFVVDTGLDVANPRGGDRFYVANVKLTHNVIKDLFWRLILQHESGSATSAASLLWGWDYRTGSTLYVAFEQRRDDADGHFRIAEQIAFLKISYMV